MTTTTPEVSAAVDHAYKALVDRYDAVAHHDQCSAQMPPINLVLDPYDVGSAAQRDKVFVEELTQLVNIGRCVGIHVRLSRVFAFEASVLPVQLRESLNDLTAASEER